MDLFSGLSEAQLAGIAAFCQEVTYAKGKMLFHEGQTAGQLFILLEGKVHLQVRLASHLDNITVEIISQPYHTLGWSGLVSPYYYTASAICQADSRLVALDGPALMQVLEADPATGFTVMRRITEIVCDRLRNTRVALLKFIDSDSLL
jgi:CRP-like cAMP-binding protein